MSFFLLLRSAAGRMYGDGNMPELVRVDEEPTMPVAPAIVISSSDPDHTAATRPSSFHPSPAAIQPEVQTVEQENFTMVTPPQLILQDQIPAADDRLEPSVLPGYNSQGSRSEQQDELSSLRDEEDYR
jgi:hypothetical protein